MEDEKSAEQLVGQGGEQSGNGAVVAASPSDESPSVEAASSEAQSSVEASASVETDASVETVDQAQQSESHVEEAAPSKPKLYDQMHWYVVHAHSGFESKAKKALEERIRHRNLDEYFGDIQVPQETVVELVRGQKKTSNRKYFPGYVLVQMVLNEDTWHLVKDTPKVSGFLGDATDPAPLSEDEVKRILSQVEEGTAAPRSRAKFEQGETVKVIDGPFTDFNGTVEEVKPEKGKVKVLISIFGRATPVELDFIQVEKC